MDHLCCHEKFGFLRKSISFGLTDVIRGAQVFVLKWKIIWAIPVFCSAMCRRPGQIRSPGFNRHNKFPCWIPLRFSLRWLGSFDRIQLSLTKNAKGWQIFASVLLRQSPLAEVWLTMHALFWEGEVGRSMNILGAKKERENGMYKVSFSQVQCATASIFIFHVAEQEFPDVTAPRFSACARARRRATPLGFITEPSPAAADRSADGGVKNGGAIWGLARPEM